jgi:hypothetical protein
MSAKTALRCLKHSFPILFLVLLAERQTVQVPGTDLTITVRSVTDFTSEGCLRGPIGCPDNVKLEITRGNLNQQVILSAAHTKAQRDQGINQTEVFGRKITLVTLKNKQVVLDIGD